MKVLPSSALKGALALSQCVTSAVIAPRYPRHPSSGALVCAVLLGPHTVAALLTQHCTLAPHALRVMHRIVQPSGSPPLAYPVLDFVIMMSLIRASPLTLSFFF